MFWQPSHYFFINTLLCPFQPRTHTSQRPLHGPHPAWFPRKHGCCLPVTFSPLSLWLLRYSTDFQSVVTFQSLVKCLNKFKAQFVKMQMHNPFFFCKFSSGKSSPGAQCCWKVGLRPWKRFCSADHEPLGLFGNTNEETYILKQRKLFSGEIHVHGLDLGTLHKDL